MKHFVKESLAIIPLVELGHYGLVVLGHFWLKNHTLKFKNILVLTSENLLNELSMNASIDLLCPICNR